MGFPENTRLAKLNTVVSCAAFSAYVVGFASPKWLQKEFLFPLNKGGVALLPVNARLGLFSACKTETYRNGNTYSSCSPEGAADWQIISAVLAIAGLVFGLIGTLLAILNLTTRKLARKAAVKPAILFFNFVTCGLLVGPLIMFPMNKRIQVLPQISTFQVDFDLGYSYFTALGTAGSYAVLVLLNIIDLLWSGGENDKDDDLAALSK